MFDLHASFPIAGFVANNAWFGVLLTIHVVGAVVGLGPTFAYSILGPLAGKVSPEGGLALLEGIDLVENKLVNPILLTTQPLTGALLIWNRGLDHDFFVRQRLWLIAGIFAYVIAVIIALGVQGPAIRKLIRLGRSGQGGTPEFGATVRITQIYGPILTILGLVIVVLMIWKPGSGCLYQC